MLTAGTLLHDRYRIDRLLEFGVMGAMYRAWDMQRNLPVTVKELTPQPELDRAVLDRLRRNLEREAQVLRRLRHPAMTSLVDYFHVEAETAAGNTYLVMEFVEGESLADRIERVGALPEAQVKAWAVQILDALEFCHSHGVLHRDIKPQNIILRPDGNAVLVGFELAKLWDPNDPRSWAATRVMGTPEYAPPERWGLRSWHIDALSDIYSLGATLYHALTGQAPQTAGERTANPYRFAPVKVLRRMSAPTRAVITRAMELPREKRFPNAAAMRAALLDETPLSTLEEVQPARLIISSRGERARRWVLLVLSGLVVLGLAGMIGVAVQLRHGTRAPVTPAISTPAAVTPATPPAPLPTSAVIPPTEAPGRPTLTPRPTHTPVVSIAAPAGWSLAFADDFQDNAHAWVVGSYTEAWGAMSRVIADGVYTWEINAVQSVGRWCTLEITPTADFYLMVDARRVKGPPDAGYGLVFRHRDGNYYLFSIRDDGFFNFNLWYDFTWNAIIDWTGTLAIRPGEVNQLAVLAEGTQFTFSINGETVATAEDAQLADGEVGLSVLLITPGEATFTFERFRLYSPGNF
ncbi:MAG TPA: protein kinase [Anaerolineae bacterium]|nr:protein kinase [Anaerolineae bacterium]HQK15680.1 protein kinase [Anaerolineae bacterium]